MNIEINSERSYLGRDIRRWCMSNTEDEKVLEVREKYYSDEVKYKPNDKVYYFVEYMSMSESYKEWQFKYVWVSFNKRY